MTDIFFPHLIELKYVFKTSYVSSTFRVEDSETWYLSTGAHSVTAQKINNDIHIAMRT
jgi:hypothetical protein